MVMIDDSDFYEDDEDPQDIRAAFDRGPHGVTAFNAHPMIHMSDCGDPHAGCRAALDAAQDEIEKRIEASERDRELIRQLGAALECVAPAAYRAIVGGAS